jgi:hypothetical protein
MRPRPTAGYSGTPLAKKLGIKAGACVCALDAPDGYRELLAPLPEGVEFAAEVSAATDIVHAFVSRRARLDEILRAGRACLRPDAALWVSWPKRASKVPTDVTEDAIRELALPLGFVDVKVCAVDETWSGLKLVVRLELRGPAAGRGTKSTPGGSKR